MNRRDDLSGLATDAVRILERMRHLCSVREYCTSDIRQKVMKALDTSDSRVGTGGDGDSGSAGLFPGHDERSSCGESDRSGIAGRIIESLKADGYLSDLRYATAFARDKSSLSGWGTGKIRYALSIKGIDSETVGAALNEIDASRASDRLDRLLSAKYKSLTASARSSRMMSGAAEGMVPDAACHTEPDTDSSLDDGHPSAGTDYVIRRKLIAFALGRGYSYEEAVRAINGIMNVNSMK